MSFRTILIKNRCKLEYSLNYLICRNEDGEKKVLLDEISTIIIQSTGVALTTALISSIADKNIKLIFCDSKSNPQSELISYHGTYDTYSKLMTQFSFTNEAKQAIWKRIIEEKIINQARILEKINKEKEAMLITYANDVSLGDSSNREGHAAKVYFNELFGNGFSRNKICDENMFLDYGYTILLSCFNRIIKSLGYYPELGIHHIGKTNPFNLSCDLMEPLRPLVDNKVLMHQVSTETFKSVYIEMLNCKVLMDDNEMYLENAIKVYVQSVMNALINNDVKLVKFIKYEL